ncbi:hypothetical protein Bhyg_03477 [Pseudolycoriella hygida]|uniref:Uncharacterized protein n=1 Tax=Pseudolycoriella hygida TaxID=35572 RepID=A0A9Q0S9I7_9DIPT|nr:hypothetical protein Bhyg_03477 [Pseudolycoriella hygida]
MIGLLLVVFQTDVQKNPLVVTIPPTNFAQCPQDFWKKSISTLKLNSAEWTYKPDNKPEERNNGTQSEAENVEMMDLTELQQEIHEGNELKEAPVSVVMVEQSTAKTEPNKDNVMTDAVKVDMPSTSFPSWSTTLSNVKNITDTPFQTKSDTLCFKEKEPEKEIRSLMSMPTLESMIGIDDFKGSSPVEVGKQPSDDSLKPLFPPNKVPFIIRTNLNNTTQRQVLINPNYDGFSSNNSLKRNENRRKSAPQLPIKGDLRNIILSKKLVAQGEIIKVSEPIKIEEEMSDEDKEYLMKIDKQKLQREQILREKEVKRRVEVM